MKDEKKLKQSRKKLLLITIILMVINLELEMHKVDSILGILIVLLISIILVIDGILKDGEVILHLGTLLWIVLSLI